MKAPIVFVILALVFARCNSDPVIAEDYRDAFVGNLSSINQNSCH